ncbi:hypothetical protein [Blastomonas sp. UPD001]|uniref:hypothetical protein n=1 Tax=Blastomonas sp. UPD001 TaxID=2217673 RepID=UPI0013004D55|nr:hypothetical protein [Blastomonas sp. UPD001]
MADTASPDAAELAKAVQALSDKEAIREQIYLYCRGVNRLQTTMVGAAFHADATDNHGMFVGGVKEFLEVGEKFAAAPNSPIRLTLRRRRDVQPSG